MAGHHDWVNDDQELGNVVWAKRQKLVFPDLTPGASYSLPFYAHHNLGPIVFVDVEGRVLRYCEDAAYVFPQYRLIWLRFDELDRPVEKYCGEEDALVYMYASPESDCDAGALEALICPERAENVFCLSDFFQDDGNRSGKKTSTRLPPGWNLHAGSNSAVEFTSSVLRVCPGSRGVQLKPRDGRVTICRSPGHVIPHLPFCTRLHCRAWFFDAMEGGRDAFCWVGFTTRVGSGAIGCKSTHYVFFNGDGWTSDGGHSKVGWRESMVPRSLGCHRFDLVWENGETVFSIDGKTLSKSRVLGPSTDEKVFLCSENGTCGVWQGVQILHTPTSQGTWDRHSQVVDVSTRRPWRVREQDTGRWLMNSFGAVKELAKDEPAPKFKKNKAPLSVARMPNPPTEAEEAEEAVEAAEQIQDANDEKTEPEEGTCKEENEVDDEQKMVPEEGAGLTALDVSTESNEENICPIVAEDCMAEKCRVRVKRKVLKRPTTSPSPPPPPAPALTIECWAKPGAESELARMDRVMVTFLDALRAAGIALPDNIQRLKQCSDAQHSNCYIYSFGTRRLHVATREVEGGRILLVVRCGGGFSDFADFAMRHGGLEQLRLQRHRDIQGRNVVRLSSVLSNGTVGLREVPFVA